MNDSTMMRGMIEIAAAAGRELQGRLGRVAVEFKGDVDLVTEADKAVEALIVERLGDLLPEAEILAEEGGGRSGNKALRWIVDPLDGTTNFAHGYPVYAVSIGLERNGEMAAGVVHDPTRGETFGAIRGMGATMNDEPLRVTECAGIESALLVTGFPYDMRTTRRDNLPQFASLAKRARGVRRDGSAALNLAYVAAGRFDGFWEEKLSPWDVAAGRLLVEEAGGTVTGYLGEPMDMEEGHIIAAGTALHAELRSHLEYLEATAGLPAVGSRQ